MKSHWKRSFPCLVGFLFLGLGTLVFSSVNSYPPTSKVEIAGTPNEGIPLQPMDTGKSTGAREKLQFIPLPEKTRLKASLLNPDSLKSRITLEGMFRVEKGDLQPDTNSRKWVPPDKSLTSREFKAFWKKVEASNGYPEFQRQMESAYRIEKSWVPKVLLFDSAVVVIPGYIFIRIGPRVL